MTHRDPEIVLSRHAWKRCQQRSIALAAIALLLDFGTVQHCGKSCEKYMFNRSSWHAATQALGHASHEFERYRDLYLIVAEDGVVVTAAWRH